MWRYMQMKDRYTTLQQYLEHLQANGRYYFLCSETIAMLCYSDNAFKKAVYRLIQKGKLNRIRGDFYTLVTPEYQVVGALPVTWFIDPLMKHLNQTYYCGLLTAAAYHDASHQQPMIFQVITNKSIRSIRLKKLQIDFLYKKVINESYYQLVKTVTGFMNVATPEMAAFDIVRYMDSSGQVNHIATILCELVNKIDAKKLGACLEMNKVEVATAQRLGYLIDFLNLPISLAPLESALQVKNATQRLFVLSNDKPIVEYNKRWNILMNEVVEPDDL